MNADNTQDGAEPSLASAGSQPMAWAVTRRTDGWIASVSMFERTAECEAGRRGDGWSAVPLYRAPTLTDEERHAIAVVRNCAMTRAERFLTQSDAEREATLVLWRLRERLG